MHKPKHFWFTILLFACLLGSFSPLKAVHSADTDVLHVYNPEPASIDPAYFSYVNEYQVAGELFASLVTLNDSTGEAEPALASSWSWNTAGDEITFTLRSGLKWSDGQPLTADDARYGILRSLDVNGPMAFLLDPILNAKAYREKSITDGTKVGVYVDSPTTLRIRLNAPMAFFEKVLVESVALPVPAHVVNAHPDNWTEAQYIVTSGPYRLDTWQHNSFMRFVANPYYYVTAPAIPQVDIQMGLSDDDIWDKYVTGNLDTIKLPVSKVGIITSDPILSAGVISIQDYCTWSLKFNTDAAPFNNLKVRQAFSAAVDRQAFIDTALSGAGIPTQTLISPGIYGHVDGPALGIGIPFDANQARQYLTEAGYPNGAGFPAVSIQANDTSGQRAVWDYLKSQWKSVLNVNVTVVYSANPAWPPAARFSGWCADYNEGYNYVNDSIAMEQGTGSLGSWNNPTYWALMQQIAQTTNPADRLPLYQQAEQIITKTDTITAPLYVSVTKNLTQGYLDREYSGFTNQPWHSWTIQRESQVIYTPSTPETFTPEGDHTTYTLPAGLFDQEMTLTHTDLREEDALQNMPNGLAGIGEIFSLDAAAATNTQLRAMAAGQTNVPYQITVAYSPEQVSAGMVGGEDTLALYALVNGSWVKQDSSVDPEHHTVSATTDQINTMFTLLGAGNYYIRLPLIRKP